ncbi:MAG: 3-phosphoshikimate 1-carboxyvinyltransferase [Clostridia bacterium]|nr:3-phosphoshikimate 1-carboxyvinyltransferase [Clostridia bacterium]
MKAVIFPSLPCGTVSAPPSKSYAHRQLICAMIAGGGKICGIELSDDIRATLRCMSALGAKYTINGDVVTVLSGIDRNIKSAALDCGESGSTLRFFIPICLALGGSFVFKGQGRLLSRPLGEYRELCEKRGVVFEHGDDLLKICGKITGGCVTVNGDKSSQYISGLLLSSPLMDTELYLALTGETESKPYIDLTVSELCAHGALIKKSGDVFCCMNSPLKPLSEIVEGDWSNAAYLYAYTFCGGNVRVNGLSEPTLQGDSVCLKLFGKLASSCPIIDIADCPDLFPALAAVAALNNGAEFVNTRRLSFKESDRAAAMEQILSDFGCYVERYENYFVIERSDLYAPKDPVYGFNDHRIVMAFCILASVLGGTVYGAEAVNKSFPAFFKTFNSLGGKAKLYDE